MWRTRSCIGSKSRTTRRTSCRIARILPSRSTRSCSESRRSSSKCMNDSRWAASRPDMHPLELAVLGAMRADHRVHDQPHAEVARRELLGDRVDQERRVVGVRLDDRARHQVAVAIDRRHEHAHDRGVVAPRIDEREGRSDDAEQLVDPARGRGPRRSAGGASSERRQAARRGDPAGRSPRSARPAPRARDGWQVGAWGCTAGSDTFGRLDRSGSVVPSGVEPVRLLIVAGPRGSRACITMRKLGRPPRRRRPGRSARTAASRRSRPPPHPEGRRRAPSPSPSPVAHARSGSSPAVAHPRLHVLGDLDPRHLVVQERRVASRHERAARPR